MPNIHPGNPSAELPSPQNRPLLTVDDLRVGFASGAGVVQAVSGISFHIDRGETLAVVGESGSGKSITALAIMRLLPHGCRVTGGHVSFDGRDVSLLSEADMRGMRGTEIGMIFQEPMTSLNPVLTVGEQIGERLRVHAGLGRAQAARRAVEMLERVHIPEPKRRAGSYPHQMSGGMQQRVMIAIALACKPKLLIADEPTTALDVTIQAQILDLLRGLQAEFGMAMLFITHDLAVVAEMAERVVVMYAGRAVEQAGVGGLFANPRMPYTRALLRSIPRVNCADGSRQRLEAPRGGVPGPLSTLTGCAFHPRCSHGESLCSADVPEFEDSGEGHLVRCRRWRELTGTDGSRSAVGGHGELSTPGA